MASHLFSCYRDFNRARVQIEIAARVLSNNADVLELTAEIDRVQGRWEKATAALERATTLDPLSFELLDALELNYWSLRRYRDAERIVDRAIKLKPDQPRLLALKAMQAWAETANVEAARATLPSSAKDDPEITLFRVQLAMCARDFDGAEEILSENPNKEILFVGALVPRQIFALWLEFLRGNHPTVEDFGVASEQLTSKVEADPTNPFLLTALSYADLALGHKEESIQQGRRAMELRPISQDAFDGPVIATWVAEVYALTNQLDEAFAQLNSLVKIPCPILHYGNLKTNPAWDPLRRILATCEVNLFPLPLHAIYPHLRSPETFSLRVEGLKPARTRRTAARTRNGQPPITTPD
jgi:tetratricopeptide (TPR) repeat protein